MLQKLVALDIAVRARSPGMTSGGVNANLTPLETRSLERLPKLPADAPVVDRLVGHSTRSIWDMLQGRPICRSCNKLALALGLRTRNRSADDCGHAVQSSPETTSSPGSRLAGLGWGVSGFVCTVFVDGQEDDQDVKGGQERHANGEADDQLVALVGDKDQQEGDHPWVGPEFVLEHGPDEHDFHEPVEEQVYGPEKGGGNGQSPGVVNQDVGNEVVGVFGELMLGQEPGHGAELGRGDQQQQDPADELKDSVKALEDEANPEGPVEQGPVPGCLLRCLADCSHYPLPKVTTVTISIVAQKIEWVLIIVQIPSEPSRHRVAVWRQLRKTGAVPVSSGVWTLPAGPVFQAELDRSGELCRNGGGTFAVIDAAPRDEAARALLYDAFKAARVDEWAEFSADCGKFEAEIAREIAKEKFTFAELEEEEQSMERLRRWYRDLKKRDVLDLPEARDADRHLRVCNTAVDGYAELVYQAVHGTVADTGQITGG